MKLRLLLASSTSIVAVAACSGASDTELFSPADSSQFGTDPASEADGSSGASGSSGSSGGSSGLASSSGGSTSGGSSSGGSSSSSSSSSSGGTKDAGGPVNSGTIACGTGPAGVKTTCTANTEVCCGSWNGGGKPSFECEPAGFVACVGGTSIGCDDRTDCPSGQVCCGTLEDNSGYTSVSCTTACNNTPGVRAVRFCDPAAAIDECVAVGKHCGPSTSLPGYSVCRD